MARHRPPTLNTLLDSLLFCPLVHKLGASIPTPRAGRPARHPAGMHLAWASLARWLGSGNRLDAELASSDLWERFVDRYNTGAATHGGTPAREHIDRLYADTHRHTRDRFCEPETLENICDAFTEASVAGAREVGLLLPTGTGSRTRPGAECTIYGDGTILRPIYKGEDGHRKDPDVKVHHRHDGVVTGTKLVHFAVRGPEPHRRVVLGVGYVEDPGREADRSVELIRKIHNYAPDGIASVVYDGAFRGVHHNTLMTELGLLVINKPHGTRAKKPRTLPLGTWSHNTPGGPCDHALVSFGGDVCDATLDDAGRAQLSEPLERVQVRRYERSGGRYRFSVGMKVRCASGDFTAWISPHPNPGDATAGRADQLRLVSPHEQLFNELYGLRNDSEAINANYKSTHIYDRAPVLGWNRQLFDLLAWSILNNSLAWWHHAATAADQRRAA